MERDKMRYELMAQNALRGLVREALRRAAEEGLPGEHHFYINFATRHPGVEMSDALRARFPDEMMIVLQHQYWDLEVADDTFSVTLSFNKLPEHLVVPFKSILSFVDPSVQFGLQFQVEGHETQSLDTETTPDTSADRMPAPAPEKDQASEDDGKPGEVVSLDAFRKK